MLVATDAQVRHAASGEERVENRAFYAVALSDMLMFSTLICFAFRDRFNPAVHKRLILIATLAILDAAFDRWPISAAWWGPPPCDEAADHTFGDYSSGRALGSRHSHAKKCCFRG